MVPIHRREIRSIGDAEGAMTIVRTPFLLAAAFLMMPGMAAAQSDAAGESRAVGHVDFGGRLFDIGGDPARVQRYQDLRSGPTVERFRYENDQKVWVFSAGADH